MPRTGHNYMMTIHLLMLDLALYMTTKVYCVTLIQLGSNLQFNQFYFA